MDVICLEGEAPGPIVATVAHCGRIMHLPMVVERHPQGGWRVRQGAFWGPRSHAVMTAVLLEASEAFANEDVVDQPGCEMPATITARTLTPRELVLAT